MRLVFFGTPAFAVDSLEALADSRHDVGACVCQPDRPAGRGRRVETPPVGQAARARGIPLLQPERLRAEEMRSLFEAHGAEIGVVVAFGKILRPRVLAIPARGFVNVHGSLLPRHRGAAPVARAILAGDKETGVSIMRLDAGMDTGPVFLSRSTPIGPDETAGELSGRLAAIGAKTLLEALDAIEKGVLEPRPQEGEPTLAPPLTKEDGRIDWARDAKAIHDRVRGVNPWPGAEATFRDKPVRIWATSPAEGGFGEPGEVVEVSKARLRVAAATGAVDLLGLQLPGKKRVSFRDFVNGTRLRAGEMFG